MPDTIDLPENAGLDDGLSREERWLLDDLVSRGLMTIERQDLQVQTIVCAECGESHSGTITAARRYVSNWAKIEVRIGSG